MMQAIEAIVGLVMMIYDVIPQWVWWVIAIPLVVNMLVKEIATAIAIELKKR
jgi:hypothetical protein